MSKLKRLAAPGFWPIKRKVSKYSISLKPGPHSNKTSIPLGIVVRDMLHYSETLAETKKILNSRQIKIDNTLRKGYNFPVGLMDVISAGNEYYRIIPSKNTLSLQKISKDESNIKLRQLKNKKDVSKGKTQLNFHDGTNILVSDAAEYRTGDVLVFDIEGKTIKDVIKMEKNSVVVVIQGNNRGTVGKIKEIVVVKGSQPNKVFIKTKDREIEIPQNYIFVLGKEKPVISLGESV
jgi:small subunit ribosomal protein S4e